jgi:ankyrin repeat protein
MDRRTTELTTAFIRQVVRRVALIALVTTLFLPMELQSQTELLAGDPVANAARDGDFQAIKNLIIRNTKLNVADPEGRTPLVLATISGHFGIVEVLLEAKARANLKDSFGNTALHWAALNGDFEISDLLIQAGLPIDDQNKQGLTAMMLASKGGFVGVVGLLLDHGGDVHLTDYTGRDAMGWARDARQPSLIKLLERALGS